MHQLRILRECVADLLALAAEHLTCHPRESGEEIKGDHGIRE
jgi:hypothetical protein